MQLQIGNSTVNCPSGQTISIPGYQGTIQCPNSYNFCTTQALKFSKRGCLGRGDPVNGECVCREGYTGDSCLMRTGLLDPEGSYDTTFLHPLAVYIGLGIIAVVVIVGLIVNRIQKSREKAAERSDYLSVHGVTGKPMMLGKAIQFPNQGRQGTSHTESIRQQALANNTPTRVRGTDALSVIRGARNQV